MRSPILTCGISRMTAYAFFADTPSSAATSLAVIIRSGRDGFAARADDASLLTDSSFIVAREGSAGSFTGASPSREAHTGAASAGDTPLGARARDRTLRSDRQRAPRQAASTKSRAGFG